MERLIDDYLTHYQPELRADLIASKSLSSYLTNQAQAMQEAKDRILAQLRRNPLPMSPIQQEIEADQQVRDLFLSLP